MICRRKSIENTKMNYLGCKFSMLILARMNASVILGLLAIFAFGDAEAFRARDFAFPIWSPQADVCVPGLKGRLDWILHVRDSDYGWREHTHRSNIAVAVNRYRGSDDEMRKMGLQLEVELIKALFRNMTYPILDSDLALYIHALLATNKNPRNFHGTDLVADLLHRVESSPWQGNPFLALALCNSRVVKYEHLQKLKSISYRGHNGTRSNTETSRRHVDVDSREAQLKALALKAFACGIKIGVITPNEFSAEMRTIEDCLQDKYNDSDGSFGNVYTTSLAVQAFTAVLDQPDWWDERKSIEYLTREAEIEVNLIKAYYTEMALNARRVKFVHDLYDGVPLPANEPPLPDSHYVKYTVLKSHMPELYHSLTLKVAKDANFYEIMQKASHVSDSFNFSSYVNNDGDPMVYSVSGIPNDAEENMFWRLCIKHRVDQHATRIRAFEESPSKLIPGENEHLLYIYSDGVCPLWIE